MKAAELRSAPARKCGFFAALKMADVGAALVAAQGAQEGCPYKALGVSVS
jgi:hypothetical protein